MRRSEFRDSRRRNASGTAVALANQRWPRVKVTRAARDEEGVMAAKKIQAKSKKTSAKKGTRKVSPTTPRGMARAVVTKPPQMID